MDILKTEKKLCICCMEEHEVKIVKYKEETIFRGIPVEFYAIHQYCDLAEEFYDDETMMNENNLAMKNEYRKLVGALSINEIQQIRKKYDVSQSDFAKILGWGEKTITRYEGYQVQDMAHDSILRKINEDSEWFLYLLKKAKKCFSPSTYKKYYENATNLIQDSQDNYLRRLIEAKYIKINGDEHWCGKTKLDLDKVIDVISYFADSKKIKNLYKVKLMKLMWYADFLSFKRFGQSITGLAYSSLPMGAVPIAHESLLELKGISYEEIDYGNGMGYKITPPGLKQYKNLSKNDILVLDSIIGSLGEISTGEIVKLMHGEKAYKETPPRNIISYDYALELSL